MPAVRAEVRALDAALPRGKALIWVDLYALCLDLHRSEVHELRAAMTVLLERRARFLPAEAVEGLIGLIRISPGWCYVDWLAAKVVGPLLSRLAPELEADLLRRWVGDPDLWVRRTALLAPLERLRRGEGDFELWTSLAETRLDERAFFIRKALGWVLRETGKKRPERLAAFLATHGDRLQGVARREATRHLPKP